MPKEQQFDLMDLCSEEPILCVPTFKIDIFHVQ